MVKELGTYCHGERTRHMLCYVLRAEPLSWLRCERPCSTMSALGHLRLNLDLSCCQQSLHTRWSTH